MAKDMPDDDKPKGEKRKGSSKDIERLKRRYDWLKADRGTWEEHWEDIATHCSPRRVGFTGYRTPGEKRMQRVYDPTGIQSNEILAAGLHGMATNPASKWFSLRVADDDLNDTPAVQSYLSAVERQMWQALYSPGTNFTTALHEAYLDLTAFGTAVLFVSTTEEGALRFQSRTLNECLIAENYWGQVDTVFRCFEQTIRQAVQEWGIDTVSDKVRERYDEGFMDEKIKIIHVVYPREEREYGKMDRQNMPWASCYFEHECEHELETGGFPEFPFLVPRWSKISGECYGRSPAMTALSDVKMLQAMSLTVIKAGQKVADPPLFVPDDGMVGPVRTVPGGLNFYRGQREIFPLPTSDKLPITFEMMEGVRNRIRSSFYVDVLQFSTDADMTATEVMQRTQERMRLLGPVVGRLEAEMLGPLITRVFGILTREDRLPRPPQEIQGKEFTVEYVSPLAMAQRQTEAQGMVQVWQMLGMFGPEIAGKVIMENQDINKTYRRLWDMFNNDPELLADEEQMAQAAQMGQAGQMAQLAGPMTGAAEQGTRALKNLADAQAGGGVDINQMIQAMTGGAPGASAMGLPAGGVPTGAGEAARDAELEENPPEDAQAELEGLLAGLQQ